jgi:Cu(I)/Ag(I) efflux system membrane fusion protein
VDLSKVWINLEAYERDLPWLREGLPVRFTATALPGETFEGVVAFIDPVVDARARTVRVRVEAENPGGRLKPDLFVSALVRATPGAAASLVIPASAPLRTGKRAVVYVRMPDADRPTFEPRSVVLGPRAGDVYVVEDGLAEGEWVVVNGQFKIDSELQIRGRPSMMSAERPEGPEAGDEENIRLQTHCPIMNLPIDRALYHDHEGQRIYVCCPGCLDEVRERAAEIISEHAARGIVFERVGEEP